jgi:hypothetical protein
MLHQIIVLYNEFFRSQLNVFVEKVHLCELSFVGPGKINQQNTNKFAKK